MFIFLKKLTTSPWHTAKQYCWRNRPFPCLPDYIQENIHGSTTTCYRLASQQHNSCSINTQFSYILTSILTVFLIWPDLCFSACLFRIFFSFSPTSLCSWYEIPNNVCNLCLCSFLSKLRQRFFKTCHKWFGEYVCRAYRFLFSFRNNLRTRDLESSSHSRM